MWQAYLGGAFFIIMGLLITWVAITIPHANKVDHERIVTWFIALARGGIVHWMYKSYQVGVRRDERRGEW
jgi:hypothetical protein